MNYVSLLGGSGFIGTRLSNRLSNRDDIQFNIVDKLPSHSFPRLSLLADVRSLNQLSAAIRKQAVIINLAAEHRDDVRPVTLYDEVNVNGAINICSVAREKFVNKIIFTSSVAVYGFAPIGTD